MTIGSRKKIIYRRMNPGDEMCCLLNNISLNTERIFDLLECRFKSNSLKTSFDFKSFPPEQPADNIKISHSSFKFYNPTVTKSTENNDDESVSSESSNDEDEEVSSMDDLAEDDHLDRLAEWEPDKNSPIVESEEEEEDNVQQMNEEITQVNPLDLPTGKFRSEEK
jgi:hypothetical protein